VLFDKQEITVEVCLEEIVKIVKKLTAKNSTLEQARTFAPNARFEW